MITVRTVADLRAALAERTGSVGLVPTMGALHDGHLSLVRAAHEENDTVVMSLFVNPTQFNDARDLAAYPRTEEADAALAAEAGVDILFAPDAAELYPGGFATSIRVEGTIAETLEGAHRGRAHFDGMATVVVKLLLAAAPDTAYFGAKDAQQVVVVRRVVADLGIPVRIAVCPTVREPDGLALSSRNVLLSPGDRARAAAIPAALRALEAAAAAGERDRGALREPALDVLAEQLIALEYLEIVDPDTLEVLPTVDRTALVVIAAKVGQTRLIDNITIA